MDFYIDHKIKIMLNKSLVGKAPPEWGREEWRRYYKAFRAAELTPRELAAMIFMGYSFTPVYSNGRRIEENFAEAHHIAFDFDSDNAGLDHLFRVGSFAWMFASFGYSTPSSTPEAPRSRVVFVFDFPIVDAQYFRELYQAIAWIFTTEGSPTDRQCKDPLRLYYGSPQCQMVGNWAVLSTSEGSLGLSTCDLLIERYKLANPPIVQAEPIKTTKIAADFDGSGMLAKLADNIATAGEGNKHWARFSNARSAGGYIASGAMDESEVTAVLVRAALSNTVTPKTAERDVLEGIKAGKLAPLYFEVAQDFGDIADG